MRSDSKTHGEGQALALREGAAFFFIVARGPVPRDRCMARDRPSPYVLLSALIPPVGQNRLILTRFTGVEGDSRTTEVRAAIQVLKSFRTLMFPAAY